MIQNKAIIFSVLMWWAASGILVASEDSIMRIITPVRLSSELGPKLDAEITQTRQILDRFRKADFNYAIWALDKLPENKEDIKKWAKTCLKSFPYEPILAIDCRGNSLDQEKLKAFLEKTLVSSFFGLRSPAVHSVIVNFDFIGNPQKSATPTETIAKTKENIQLIRDISKDAFIWLQLNDGPRSPLKASELTESLGHLVNGYYMWRGHGLNMLRDDFSAKTAQPLLATGKSVIRGGFTYVSPRVRRGIEQDLRDQYKNRLSRYEKWIADNGYAGYSRLLGESIPNGVRINMVFSPEWPRMRAAEKFSRVHEEDQ